MTKSMPSAAGRQPVSMGDRWLIMGLAGKLLWTNERIVRTVRWVGQEACRVWAARGRQGCEDVDDCQEV